MDVLPALRRTLQDRPIDWFVVCGSGIGGAMQDGLQLRERVEVPFSDLGLPVPHVAGHGKSLVWGMLGERAIAVQSGRLHPYEGHDMSTSTALLDAGLRAGAQSVLLTAAVGSLRDALGAGAVALLKDQVNLFGPTPLRGPQFIDCSELYTASLRATAHEIAKSRGWGRLPEAVYIHARGPQYETPAETDALRTLGGDVVGMSTTYEAILARAHGARCVGLGVVTNDAGATGLSHEEVQQVADAARGELVGLVEGILAQG